MSGLAGRTAAALVAIAVVMTSESCHQPQAQSGPVVSDRSEDPGAVPTTTLSFEALAKTDPAVRRASFQQILISLGKQCTFVTEAVLKGGFEGTDFWGVTCGDTGEWLVTFSNDIPPAVTSCKASPKECVDAWRSVSAAP
jgi:hypothetical protein